jgi:hypothetical protein
MREAALANHGDRRREAEDAVCEMMERVFARPRPFTAEETRRADLGLCERQSAWNAARRKAW